MTEDQPNETTTTEPPHTPERRIQRRWYVLGGMFTTLLFVTLYGWLLTTAPSDFPDTGSFEVTPGMSARSIAESAVDANLVRSSSLLYLVLATQHDPSAIFAGRYVFSEPTSVFGVAAELASQNITEELIRVTFPEGIPAATMVTIATAELPDFDQETYRTLADTREGYLFPDTYFLPVDFTAEALIELQQTTLEQHLTARSERVTSSLFSTDEIITLASVVEREANDETSMKMVAGIFQNRLDIGMALQADATIEYVLETPLNELPPGQLAAELRDTDSPYNTYLYRGLPPTPIGNPGLVAIDAVLEPTPSDYLYYITGNDGVFYYAETLDEHNINIARHLR